MLSGGGGLSPPPLGTLESVSAVVLHPACRAQAPALEMGLPRRGEAGPFRPAPQPRSSRQPVARSRLLAPGAGGGLAVATNPDPLAEPCCSVLALPCPRP